MAFKDPVFKVLAMAGRSGVSTTATSLVENWRDLLGPRVGRNR